MYVGLEQNKVVVVEAEAYDVMSSVAGKNANRIAQLSYNIGKYTFQKLTK